MRTRSLQAELEDAAGIGADGHPASAISVSVGDLLKQREFNPNAEPPPLRAIYTLANITVSTPGNLTAITASIKTGKTAVIGAAVAAAMPHNHEADLLGFNSANPKQLALLWFDSEQSPDDFWHCVRRAVVRAGLTKPPDWLHAYCLTGLGCMRAWECAMEATRISLEKHGGIHSMFLDGAADFVKDVNDAAESNAFVAELHAMTIRHECPIIGVIHFNPGTEKTRGHLGSQLERKAETNLRLDKANGVTTIWSDKQRRAPIPKNAGPCFVWSEEAGMHVSVQTRQSAADKEKRDELALLADELFRKRPAMHYTDIIKVLTAKKGLALKERTAARRVSELSRFGIITKSAVGLWIKTTK